MSLPEAPCLVRFGCAPAPRARLFCFPYAGGNSSVYARWHRGLPGHLDVCAVELPGHGRRLRTDPPVMRMSALVEELSAQLEPALDLPYFLFGHSLGALVAYLCARTLRERGAPPPEHLLPAGRIAPDRGNPDRSALSLTDGEFIAMLRDRGGTPPEILAEPELTALLLPVIRADFGLLDSHAHTPAPPLDCPITAFGGTGDERASEADLVEWAAYTRAPFSLELFPGGHFFINSSRDQVVARTAQIVESARSG